MEASEIEMRLTDPNVETTCLALLGSSAYRQRGERYP